MIEPGTILAHYEILRLLGKGGMGEVYAAHDRKLGREVAIKVLPEDFANDAERRARFEREARTVAALQHPNIVTIHSVEEVEGVHFLVMELVSGRPLSELIPPGGLALERFLEIAIPIADAVAAAHGRGITHRDLKPANILVDIDGRVRVLDFGLARTEGTEGLSNQTVQPTEALTGEGRIVGTFAYMSPEQVEGRAVDSRSDIFSLGVVFYEMATGKAPFEGETSMSVMTAILRDEPISVTERNERLPRYLGRIVKRCLQKETSRRYQSAIDLKNDLDELREELASGELEAPSAATGSRRPPLWTVAVLVVALLGSALVWWNLRGAGEDTSPSAPSHEIRRLTVLGSPRAAAISPDGRYVAYESSDGGRRRLRLQQIASGSDITLAESPGWDHRFNSVRFSADSEFVHYTLGGASGSRALYELPVLGGTPRQLADGIIVGGFVSPDGAHIAYVPGSSFADRWLRLEIVSLTGGEKRTVLELTDEGDIEEVAWSPDSERVAVNVNGPNGAQIWLISASGGQPVKAPGEPLAGISDICWRRAGSELVVVGSEGGRSQLWSVDTATGSRRRLISDFNDFDGCTSTADGNLIATVRNEIRSQLWVLPVADPQRADSVETTTGRTDGSDGVAWLDGSTLLYTAPTEDTWELYKVPSTGGRSVRLTTGGASGPFDSQAGRIVFEGGWSATERQGVYTVDPTGGTMRRLSPSRVFAERPYLSRDGEWIYYEILNQESIDLVRVPWSGGDAEVAVEGQAHLVSYAPDGKRFNVHVFNPDTDRFETLIIPHDLGPPETVLDLHSENYSPWASNEALYIAKTVDEVANIFRVDIDSLQESQVTNFSSGSIFAFSVSPDLEHLAVARGEVVNDLILIEGLLAPGK